MPAVPHQAPRLIIVKLFTYRGKPEEWQSIYSFDPGGAPTTPAGWLALADAVISHLQPCFTAVTTFVRAYGYPPMAAVSDWVHDYTAPPNTPLAGTLTGLATEQCPGDVAATLRFISPDKSIKGKNVYIRKFFHGVHPSGSSFDQLDNAQKAAIELFGQTWNADQIHPGFTPWSPGMQAPDGSYPRPAVKCSGPHVDPYLTTRTLHRRGKRKKTPTTP